MKKVNTELNIECLIECPHCEEIFDLFDMPGLTDDGYLYQELLPPDETWGKENWGEIVQCPECGEKMVIDRVDW